MARERSGRGATDRVDVIVAGGGSAGVAMAARLADSGLSVLLLEAGMIYVRGHRTDYDRWRDLGADGWGADDVFPYFRRIETTDRQGGTHGQDGPLGVAENSARHPIVDAFLKAAQDCGIPRNPDHNGTRSPICG